MLNKLIGQFCIAATVLVVSIFITGQAPEVRAADPVDDLVATPKNVTFDFDVLSNDVDNLDVVFANSGGPLGGQINRVCHGNGSGGFFNCINVSADSFESNDVTMANLNGDSFPDAIFANEVLSNPTTGAVNHVCLGNGIGGFTSCTSVSADTRHSYGVAVGLLNNDAHLDAVFANSGTTEEENQVCLGNGSGGFTSCSDIATGAPRFSVRTVLADLDGGNLDAIFANSGQQNRRCLGNGAGAFPPGDCANADVAAESWGIAATHLNNDAHIDLVFARGQFGTSGRNNRVCLGNGSGGFACSNLSSDTFGTSGVALANMNADTHIDAVFANGINIATEPNRICFGDGTGAFATCSNVSADTNRSRDVALADLNNDGNVDAVFANADLFAQRNRVCLGTGTGSFSGCSDVSTDMNGSLGLAFGLVGLDLSTVSVSDPPNGSASVNGNGTIHYIPDPGFVGLDTFTYMVEGDQASITVIVHDKDYYLPVIDHN